MRHVCRIDATFGQTRLVNDWLIGRTSRKASSTTGPEVPLRTDARTFADGTSSRARPVDAKTCGPRAAGLVAVWLRAAELPPGGPGSPAWPIDVSAFVDCCCGQTAYIGVPRRATTHAPQVASLSGSGRHGSRISSSTETASSGFGFCPRASRAACCLDWAVRLKNWVLICRSRAATLVFEPPSRGSVLNPSLRPTIVPGKNRNPTIRNPIGSRSCIGQFRPPQLRPIDDVSFEVQCVAPKTL